MGELKSLEVVAQAARARGAQLNLFWAFMYATPTALNPGKRRRGLKAAEQGYAEAQFNLGWLYIDGFVQPKGKWPIQGARVHRGWVTGRTGRPRSGGGTQPGSMTRLNKPGSVVFQGRRRCWGNPMLGCISYDQGKYKDIP